MLLKFQTASIAKTAHIQEQKSQVRNQLKQNIKRLLILKNTQIYFISIYTKPKTKKKTVQNHHFPITHIKPSTTTITTQNNPTFPPRKTIIVTQFNSYQHQIQYTTKNSPMSTFPLIPCQVVNNKNSYPFKKKKQKNPNWENKKKRHFSSKNAQINFIFQSNRTKPKNLKHILSTKKLS